VYVYSCMSLNVCVYVCEYLLFFVLCFVLFLCFCFVLFRYILFYFISGLPVVKPLKIPDETSFESFLIFI